MTIKEMKERKRELGYTNEKLSAISGVPVGTLQKIFSGLTKAPRMDTIADYDALPEDARMELIDGKFYDLAEAHSGHQAVAGYIYSLFLQYVLKNCRLPVRRGIAKANLPGVLSYVDDGAVL